MKKIYWLLLIATIAIACNRQVEPSRQIDIQGHITVRTKTTSIKIPIAIADTKAERKKGLMKVSYMAEAEGMLFIYQEEQILNFWMKNTYIPLDIAFIDSTGIIVDIQTMAPMTTTSHESKHAAQYALEMNAGWFSSNHVNIGNKFTDLPKPKGHNNVK